MRLYAHLLFPKFYDRIVKGPALERGRRRQVPLARGRVLEIGIGTGLNLPYFPDGVSAIHGIDPNPGMLRQLSAKTASSPRPVTPVRAGAERLPYPADTFDTVLSTHTLCSLPDLTRGLAEIARVLRPDGRFVFVEHGKSPDPEVARWQRRLNHVQRIVAVGCRLDLAIDVVVREAGFVIERISTDYAEAIPRTHGYIYEGVARLSATTRAPGRAGRATGRSSRPRR